MSKDLEHYKCNKCKSKTDCQNMTVEQALGQLQSHILYLLSNEHIDDIDTCTIKRLCIAYDVLNDMYQQSEK